MRDGVLKLLIAAMLFVSTESIAEPVDETSFHQTHHAHAEDGNQWYPDSDGNEHDSDACQHFCHVHVVALTPQISTPAITGFKSRSIAPDSGAIGRAAEPPTPPPNI